MSTSGGYVQRLASPQATEKIPQELSDLSDEIYRELGVSNEDDELGSGRKTSDWRVFTYYIQVAGVRVFSVYFFICIAYSFGLSFPCECPSEPYHAITPH